ncbi:rho GTPase-activating protein 32-like isoform X3 [Daphnia pulex]|uniref:rho GTPase-activating protein 32-like isoform X3 n=1 Tax=Daphnia pulex TaxID=6669 RepID=UPI001EDD4DD3|nr:rho GTPase-activating protein 32-like isoform X3 [Daphnia pulex]
MLRSRSLDLSFIRRRGRKRSAILGSVGQAFFRSTCVMAAVTSASDLLLAAPSKRSRGLADIDPKFVSNSGLSGLSELGTPRGGSVRIQHRPPKHPVLSSSSNAAGAAGASGMIVTSCSPSSAAAAVETSRFPKLDECAHFHYDVVDLGPLTVALRPLLSNYVNRLSAIAGNLINCAPVLNWLEVDNRGRRLYPPPPSDDADAEINTPAVAAAYAVRRYAAVASDEISFEVGDMISVIDMPPPEESMWWRGKRGFDVGFFPSECVRIIGDKVPAHLSLPNTTPVVVVGGGSGGGGSNPGGASSSSKTQHLLNQSGCSGGGGSGSSSAEHLPTKPVLRKHGKLISFFRSFILSRPSRRKLKQSGILKERVFGCDLGEHLLNSGREIPMVLKCCAEFIEEYGIVDGIYRLSGITSNIQKLRNAFDEDRVPALVEDEAIRQDMHAVSSLLKMYFRELPNPLCTYQLYDQFVNAVQGPDHLRVVRMREVVQQLPPPHFRTLEYLTRHLARVAENNASTGMTAKNVAIVWAPNLLRCKELEFGGVAALQGVGVQAVVTECLVRYVDLIFSDKVPAIPVQLSSDEQPSSVGGGGALKRTRPKSLAISTPTKLLSLEEARNRALQLASSQNDTQYIEVGGGPASLPPKYHTVIELPNGDARSKRGHSLKHKKSPLGWKSLFAKPSKGRSPSANKAQRKNSSASTSSTVSMPAQVAGSGGSCSSATPQRAMTYVRPRLRPVKSAESLVASNRNSSAGESSQLTSPAEAVALITAKPADHQSERSSGPSPLRDGEDSAVRLAGDGDDESIQDGSLSRCHNRSVSHDSYFRLLMTSRTGSMQVDPLDEEGDASPEASARQPGQSNDAIYAEISKSGTKNSKEETTRTRGSPSVESPGLEFGKNMNLTAVEDPHSGSSKMSLIDLSHLDDSELNIMNSREMLAVSKKLSDDSSRQISGGGGSSSSSSSSHHSEDGSCVGRARPASVDDSVIDDSARGMPMNAEQIDGKGNWAASNPAYELFCIQAEVHHHHRHHRMDAAAGGGRSPSPDNTDAQMPDMPSEMAMDGDNDSLVNVTTEDYSSTEVPVGSDDRESYTLHGLNDVYENVNVADNRTADVESLRRTTSSPAPAVASAGAAYENFADNHAYAMVRVSSTSQDATYENVIDPAIVDEEEYEPIEPPLDQTAEPVGVSYENVDQAKYENIEQQQQQQHEAEMTAQSNYENLDQPSYENIDEGGASVADVGGENDTIDVDGGETYENVVLRDTASGNKSLKPLEIVNVYEDVIPPPPRTDESEEVIYYQVKVLRQSIQEVNELLREDPTVLQIAIADLGDYPVRNNSTTSSPVKIRASPAKEAASESTATTPVSLHERKDANSRKTSAAKDSPSSCDAKLSAFVIKDIDDAPPKVTPPKGVRLSLSPKLSSSDDSDKQAESSRNVKEQQQSQQPHHHLPLSVSLPSLLNTNNKMASQKLQTSSSLASPPPPHKMNTTSLPPTPLYDLHPESESVSSKRRFESEIGRDLLRERRIRNEIENSRRSESNLLQSSEPTSPARRLSTSESSSSLKSGHGGKPALPIKLNSSKRTEPPKNLQPLSPVKKMVEAAPQVVVRPTTLETSFDYEPTPLQRRASSPLSSVSPLSPVSPTSEGRNFTSSAARKTSVKELLNKFQTGGDNNSERSNQQQQQRVSTPTSPVKPATPVSSPNNKQLQQQQQQLATHLLDESKKMKDEGKENIEIHLAPPKSSPIISNNPVESERCEMMMLGESNTDACKTMMQGDSALDQDAKELLRQKSLGIDMSDPRTRLRIERYKEERRSFLREKYKSESFRSDSKEDAVIVRLKQKAGSPTHQQNESGGELGVSPPPPPSLQTPHPGLIDEDVNVKERAAQWAQTLPATLVAAAAVAAATATTTTATVSAVPISIATSPIKTVSPTHRSCSEAVGVVPQHKRIRDMAALFEKETP